MLYKLEDDTRPRSLLTANTMHYARNLSTIKFNGSAAIVGEVFKYRHARSNWV